MNLYEILGIAKDATKEVIKKHYRKLAKIHHPDKGGDKEEFGKINLAYEVLSDDVRREKYDRTGSYEQDKSKQDQFVVFIMQVIMPKIEESDDYDFDLIAFTKNKIQGFIKAGQDQIDAIDKFVKKLSPAADRVKRKDEGQNLIGSVILGKIASLENKKANLQKEIEDLNGYTEEIDKYEWEFSDKSDENGKMSFIDAMSKVMEESMKNRSSNKHRWSGFGE